MLRRLLKSSSRIQHYRRFKLPELSKNQIRLIKRPVTAWSYIRRFHHFGSVQVPRTSTLFNPRSPTMVPNSHTELHLKCHKVAGFILNIIGIICIFIAGSGPFISIFAYSTTSNPSTALQ